MNKRQKMKKLKSENELMRNIIRSVDEMQRLYDLYHRPVNVTTSKINFKPYRCKRIMSYDLMRFEDGEKVLKRDIEKCLTERIKPEITYRLDREAYPAPTLEGTIWIGKPESKEYDWEAEKIESDEEQRRQQDDN